MSIHGVTSPLSRGGVFSGQLYVPAASALSGSITIRFGAHGRLGLVGYASSPKFSARGRFHTVGLVGHATVGRFSAHGKLGLTGRVEAPPITVTATVVSYDSMSGHATFPSFSLRPLLYGAISFPRFSAAGRISASSSYTRHFWITNLTTGETTDAPVYDFIRVLRFGSKVYGVKSDGLYLLESGSSAAGVNISAYVETHPSDLGADNLKRVHYIYTTSPGTVDVTPTCDGTTVGTYRSTIGHQRTRLALGAKGLYWSFKVANVSGGALKLSLLEPLIYNTSRRV